MKKVNVEHSESSGDVIPESADELESADGATQAEESLGSAANEVAAAEPAATRIEDELLTLQKERDHLADQLLRARAEFDNYRKRMAREAERTRQVAAESLIRDVLPVVDHLDLALKHAEDHPGALGEGVSMVLRQFQEALAKHGVQPIPAIGEPFDPNVHEAVMQQESESTPPDVVVEEFQKGYRLGQMVLRPAKVVVSVGCAPSSSSEEENPDGPPMEHSAGDADQT
jgi:molecular chaperone GrpE